MYEHAPGQGDESDILGIDAKGREEHEEEQRVSEGAAHAGAAKDNEAQGFVDDVGKHGAQCQKGQAHLAKKAGGG